MNKEYLQVVDFSSDLDILFKPFATYVLWSRLYWSRILLICIVSQEQAAKEAAAAAALKDFSGAPDEICSAQELAAATNAAVAKSREVNTLLL